MEQDKKRPPLGSFADLCSYLLLGLFAVLALFCVLIGAEVYRNTVESGAENNSLRNSVSYVTGKLRAADARGAVRLADGPEGMRLELSETIDGEEYITHIYGWQGNICELFMSASGEFDPEAGQPVSEADSFSAAFARPGLIRLEVGIDDEIYASHVALKTVQEG